MSETRAVVREEIRLMLGDTSSSDSSFSNEQINRAIQRHMRLIGNEVLQGQAWVTSAITTVAGTSDYTFPSGVEYAQILTLKLQPYNAVLRPVTLEWIELSRQGTTLGQGVPYTYAIWEDTSQTVNLRLWPVPNAVYTIDLERSIIPAALTAETSTLPFSENLITALEYRVAGELLAHADDNVMKQLGIGPMLIQSYQQTADRAMRKERERLSRLYSVPGIGRASI